MTTLAQMTLDVASYLARPYRGTATGGSTTTVVDSALNEPNDYFTGGTIWLLSGNNAGKSTAITTWNNTTKTFTFAAMSLANAAGNRYAAANQDYPRWLLIDAVNQALKAIGDLPKYDTSLTTVADQEEYTIPSGIGIPYAVEIALYTSAPYVFIPHYNWRVVNGKIVFAPGAQPDETGYTMRITYQSAHAELVADTDTLDQLVHPERVKWRAVEYALRWMLSKRGTDDRDITPLLAEAAAKATAADLMHPIVRAQLQPKFPYWG